MKCKMVLAIALMLTQQGAALGQAYPSKPVTIVNGFPPGGATDVVVRQLAARLGERLSQPVIVENRPGAAGTIAGAAVAKAPPDGHTLLFGVAANLAVGPATMASPPYDPTSAFTPIVEIARGPYLWLVRGDEAARDMAAFIEQTRRARGKMNYASPGQGSLHHLATELLKRKTGADMTHVPYKGGAPMAGALLAGEVQGMFDSPGPYLAHIKAGKVRALAVTGAKRLETLQDVPTFAEQGLPVLDVHSWWGLVGPAGLSKEVVSRLNAEVARALADPALKATLAKQNVEPSPGTPEAFGAYISGEWRRWKEFVSTTGMRF